MDWRPTIKIPDLSESTIHLFDLDISGCEVTAKRVAELLPLEEQARLQEFSAKAAQKRFLYGRLLLRFLLSHYLECPSKDLQLSYTARGKPFLADSSIRFNFSHTHDRVCLGVVLGPTIGVDLEYVDHNRNLAPIARRYFSEAEKMQLQESAEMEQAFFATWARKEAYLKATGHGISTRLSAIDTTQVSLDGFALRSFATCERRFQGALAYPVDLDPSVEGWTATGLLQEAL